MALEVVGRHAVAKPLSAGRSLHDGAPQIVELARRADDVEGRGLPPTALQRKAFRVVRNQAFDARQRSHPEILVSRKTARSTPISAMPPLRLQIGGRSPVRELRERCGGRGRPQSEGTTAMLRAAQRREHLIGAA